jgi:peptide/nickel transport system substrate-binding protein
MRKNVVTKLAASLLVTVFAVAACTQSNEAENTQAPTQTPGQTQAPGTQPPAPTQPGGAETPGPDAAATLFEILERFPMQTSNQNPPIEGGIKVTGIIGNGPGGNFNPIFSTSAEDSTIHWELIPGIVSTNSSLMLSRNGLAHIEFDIEAMTATWTMTGNATWNDGHPVTLDDIVWAYEQISHPRYAELGGVRYGSSQAPLLVGIEEFRSGEADHIAGLVLSDDKRTLVMHFTDMNPGMMYGGSIWTTPSPRHRFEGIPFDDIPDHRYSRYDILGWGPWLLDNFVPGESALMVPNPDWWLGAPMLEGHVFTWMLGELRAPAMLEGTVDRIAWTPALMADFPDADNFQLLADVSRVLWYEGFRFGIANPDTTQWHIMDETRQVHSLPLRRAIGYAIDDVSIARYIFNGMQFPNPSVLSTFHLPFMDRQMMGFSIFDLEKAGAVLDEAGYGWASGQATRQGDNDWRTNPDGSPLVVTWAERNPLTSEAQSIWPIMIENWHAVGINVQLWNDGFTDGAMLNDILSADSDDGEIDTFSFGFSMGFNPSPRSLWGPIQQFNRIRYVSQESYDIMNRIDSKAAFDWDYNLGVFFDWQHYFYENALAIPRRGQIVLEAVNLRVRDYSLERQDGIHNVSLGANHLWRLTANQPYRN